MTIRRDDLVAAAGAGLLQYRQVDPLLVFLLQRDITARREAMLAEVRSRRVAGLNSLLSFTAAVLALATAVMFGVLFAGRAVTVMGAGAYAVFGIFYAVSGLALAAWFRRRGHAGRVRLTLAILMASLPLAVVALQ